MKSHIICDLSLVTASQNSWLSVWRLCSTKPRLLWTQHLACVVCDVSRLGNGFPKWLILSRWCLCSDKPRALWTQCLAYYFHLRCWWHHLMNRDDILGGLLSYLWHNATNPALGSSWPVTMYGRSSPTCQTLPERTAEAGHQTSGTSCNVIWLCLTVDRHQRAQWVRLQKYCGLTKDVGLIQKQSLNSTAQAS